MSSEVWIRLFIYASKLEYLFRLNFQVEMGEMDYLDLPVHVGNQARPVSLLFNCRLNSFFYYYYLFSFTSPVIISIIIMCFQLDLYDCRVEFDVT